MKKRFSGEQIVRMLRQAEAGNRTVAEVCKAQGISEQTWYRWKKQFGQMNVPDVRRLRESEKDNTRRKRIVAERDLEIDGMKEVLRTKFWKPVSGATRPGIDHVDPAAAGFRNIQGLPRAPRVAQASVAKAIVRTAAGVAEGIQANPH